MVPGHILAANPAECFSVLTDPAPHSFLKKIPGAFLLLPGVIPTENYSSPGPCQDLAGFPRWVFFCHRVTDTGGNQCILRFQSFSLRTTDQAKCRLPTTAILFISLSKQRNGKNNWTRGIPGWSCRLSAWWWIDTVRRELLTILGHQPQYSLKELTGENPLFCLLCCPVHPFPYFDIIWQKSSVVGKLIEEIFNSRKST